MTRPTKRTVVTTTIVLALVGVAAAAGVWFRDSRRSAVSTTATVAPTTTTTGVLPRPIAPPKAGYVDEYVEMGTVEIPEIGVTEKLLKGITLKTFDKGIGWWPGTAEPGGYGNMVLGGHRTTPPKPFRNLDRLSPGDEVIVSTASGRFVYRITKTQIVDDTDLWIVGQSPGYTLTLFACHPVGSTAQRIVVFGTLKME